MNLHKLYVAAMVSALCISAQPLYGSGAHTEGEGPLTKETRSVGAFSKIKAEGPFQVVVTLKSPQEVVVEAQANLMQFVQTKVVGDALVISSDRRDSFESHKEISVFVSVPTLVGIESKGSGDVSVDQLLSKDFSAHSTGSGNLRLSGKLGELHGSLKGSGNFDARNLQVENLIILEVLGSGDVTLHGQTKEFHLNQRGSGDVKAKELRVDRLADLHLTGSGTVEVCVSKEAEAKGSLLGSGDILIHCHPKLVAIQSMGSGSVRQD